MKPRRRHAVRRSSARRHALTLAGGRRYAALRPLRRGAGIVRRHEVHGRHALVVRLATERRLVAQSSEVGCRRCRPVIVFAAVWRMRSHLTCALRLRLRLQLLAADMHVRAAVRLVVITPGVELEAVMASFWRVTNAFVGSGRRSLESTARIGVYRRSPAVGGARGGQGREEGHSVSAPGTIVYQREEVRERIDVQASHLPWHVEDQGWGREVWATQAE